MSAGILGSPKKEREGTLIWGDSREELKKIKEKSVHLVVTSPPYPMVKKWDKLFKTMDFESQHVKMLDPVWKQCYRVLVDGGIACINIGDATRRWNGVFQCYPNYSRVSSFAFSLGFTLLIPILWKKIGNKPNSFLGSGMSPPNAYVSQDCEYIVILRKGGLRKFKLNCANRKESMYTLKERNVWFSQIWSIPGKKGARKDSGFPKEIPYRLIRMFSVIGDVVLDPFAGMDTTGRVARSLQRKSVSITIKNKKGISCFLK